MRGNSSAMPRRRRRISKAQMRRLDFRFWIVLLTISAAMGLGALWIILREG